MKRSDRQDPIFTKAVPVVVIDAEGDETVGIARHVAADAIYLELSEALAEGDVAEVRFLGSGDYQPADRGRAVALLGSIGAKGRVAYVDHSVKGDRCGHGLRVSSWR